MRRSPLVACLSAVLLALMPGIHRAEELRSVPAIVDVDFDNTPSPSDRVDTAPPTVRSARNTIQREAAARTQATLDIAVPPNQPSAAPAPPEMVTGGIGPMLPDGFGGDCCECSTCGWYGHVEYAHWWLQGSDVPVLATTAPLGTPRPTAGVLGVPTTQTVFGGTEVDDDGRSGLHTLLGYRLGDARQTALEVDYLALERLHTNFMTSSAQHPILMRPFFNVALPGEDRSEVAFPGETAGTLAVRTSSEFAMGGVLMRQSWFETSTWRIEQIGGYRYARFRDRIDVSESSEVIQPGGTQVRPGVVVPFGTRFDILDRFAAKNDFHGGDLGLAARWWYDAWMLDVQGKVAFGMMRQKVEIDGRTSIRVPPFPAAVFDGGLLALGSNSGRFERNELTWSPSVDLTLHYALAPGLTLAAGYSSVWYSEMVRAAGQIDRRLNPAQFPPVLLAAADPVFRFRSDDFWAHGIHAGIVWER